MRVKGHHGSRAAGTTFSERGPSEVLTLSALLKFPHWGESTVCSFQSKFFPLRPAKWYQTQIEIPPLLSKAILSFEVDVWLFPPTTAQGSVDEKPDDYWRGPQVQADLRSGHLLPGDPSAW